MHPVALAALGGFGVMAVIAGFVIWEMHQQERAFRESAYYSGHSSHSQYFREDADAVPHEDEAQNRVLEGVYAEARDDLRKVSRMLPGDERRRAVRVLRSRYHPDKYPVSLRGIMTEVSSFINSQTERLL